MNKLSILMVMFSTLILFLQACAPTSAPEPAPTPSPGNGRTPPAIPITEFVRQTFIGGVPFEEASRYDATAVPILLDMLNDPAEETNWANIVVVLNIIGDDSVAEPIIAFINQGVEGQLSRAYYSAKTSALLSLGYLINRTGSEEALTYLIASLDPDVWNKRGTTGINPFQSNMEDSHLELSKHAILGLALSGNSTAAEALRALPDAAASDSQRAFQAQVSEMIPEALATNEEIANEGLVNYYRNLDQN